MKQQSDSSKDRQQENIMKKLALLRIALVGLSGAASAITMNIDVNDRPYYVHGPSTVTTSCRADPGRLTLWAPASIFPLS
jgi:hypothetical protein